MKKFLGIIFLFFLISFFILNKDFFIYLFFKNNTLNFSNQLAQAPQKEASLPDPLVYQKYDKTSYLTQKGILEWTNFYRNQNNLKLLEEDEQLDKIAYLRIKDMFEKQYFAHYSKSGIGAPEIAQNVSYKYITIGENIALGNFSDDKELVDAWMASEGHRKNILNARYTKIGIALEKGNFFDENSKNQIQTWIIVQVFAKPESDCPIPDKNLEQKINDLKTEIENLKAEADSLKDYLNKNNILKTPQEIIFYNEKVSDYNNLVNKINDKISEIKDLISIYNKQVENFNNCAGL
jgi:uncharacterized protein YkwD